MATYSSVLAWRILGMAEPGGLPSMGFGCYTAVDHSSQETLPQPWVSWASPVAQMVKNPLVMLETWVQSLAWEDPLEKGMATHSSIFAWRIPWLEEPGRLQSTGSQRVGHY